MRKILGVGFCVFLLAMTPGVYADFVIEYHDDSHHPYHHRHQHYRGGYVYCSVCHLYHHPSHHHFYHHHAPVVVEHHTDVQTEYVAETREIVE